MMDCGDGSPSETQPLSAPTCGERSSKAEAAAAGGVSGKQQREAEGLPPAAQKIYTSVVGEEVSRR